MPCEMDILCCDKTGTLTQGVMKLETAIDLTGQVSEKVRDYTYLNAALKAVSINRRGHQEQPPGWL